MVVVRMLSIVLSMDCDQQRGNGMGERVLISGSFI